MKKYAPQLAKVSRTIDPQTSPLSQASLSDLLDRKMMAPELHTAKLNNTGLPDNLKAGVEHYSDRNLDDVKVHYNSSEPARFGALAFTQLPNIFVAPGQEKYIPHEAWHAAQQKMEIVKPTARLRKVDINDDAALEREADTMGNLTASYTPSPDDKAPTERGGSGSVLQPMIGFEFQTGWNIQKDRRLLSTRQNDPNLGQRGKALDKGDKIHIGNGFTVEADDDNESMSQIEFVTKPFENKDEMQDAFNDMTDYGNFLIRTYPNLNHWTVFSGKWWINIKPTDDVLSANPQVTFAIPLTAQHDLMACRNHPIYEQTSTHLDGLAFLMKSYIVKDADVEYFENNPLNYPKRITDNYMLSRTRFDTLFALAKKLDGRPNLIESEWMDYFSDIDGVDDLGRNLFPQIKDKTPTLTIRQWIKGVYHGKDLVAKVEDAEGMGRLGSKTDTLPDGSQGGIFEYRLEQGNPKTLAEWPNFANNWYDQINNLLPSATTVIAPDTYDEDLFNFQMSMK